MSTKEFIFAVVNRLTEEELDELAEIVEEKFSPEPPNTVHSKAELEAMLAEAEESIRNGNFYTEEEMDIFFKENFGI